MVSNFANSRSPRLLPEWAVSVIIPQPSFSKVDMPIHGLSEIAALFLRTIIIHINRRLLGSNRVEL